jgi:hypothetical protein
MQLYDLINWCLAFLVAPHAHKSLLLLELLYV